MKRNNKRTLKAYDNDAFFGNINAHFAVYDHDLILFEESCGSYLPEALDDYKLIGGRSAHPLGNKTFASALGLTKSEENTFLAGMSDSTKKFLLLFAGQRTVLVSTSLFRAYGLGVAAVLAHKPRHIAAALREGLIPNVDDIKISEKLLSAEPTGEFEISDAYESLNCLILALDAMTDAATPLPIALGLMAQIAGCGLELYCALPELSELMVDRGSLSATLVCLFLLCRRLAADRTAKVELTKCADGCLGVRVSFDIAAAAALTSRDRDCIEFCDTLSQKYEMPLSLDIDSLKCDSKFVPIKADPSLCGLKAGVRINIKYQE